MDFLNHFSRESIVVVFGTITLAIHKYTKDTCTCSLIDLRSPSMLIRLFVTLSLSVFFVIHAKIDLHKMSETILCVLFCYFVKWRNHKGRNTNESKFSVEKLDGTTRPFLTS